MSYYDAEVTPGNWELLGALLRQLYEKVEREFDIEEPRFWSYNQYAVYLLQCFGINMGYGYSYFPPHSAGVSLAISKLDDYVKKNGGMPSKVRFTGNSKARFEEYLSFMKEAGTADPYFIKMLAAIMHIKRNYDFTDSKSIRTTMAHGMYPSDRYDEAVALLRKYGILEAE